jgi:hypothetical protein
VRTAPLRKVVKHESRQKGCDMTRRGNLVDIRWHYEKVNTLECGHVLTSPFSSPDRDRMRCKKCLVVEATP